MYYYYEITEKLNLLKSIKEERDNNKMLVNKK